MLHRVAERLARRQKHMLDYDPRTTWREEDESSGAPVPFCTAHACLRAAISCMGPWPVAHSLDRKQEWKDHC